MRYGVIGMFVLALATAPAQQKAAAGKKESGQPAAAAAAAMKMLDHTNQARAALSDRKKEEADKHIKEARGLADKLAADAQRQGRKVIPIYSQYEVVAVTGPIRTVQGQASADRAARQEKAKGETGKAAGEDVNLTSVIVDPGAALKGLNAAKAALDSGDLAKADDNLRDVQMSVLLMSVPAPGVKK